MNIPLPKLNKDIRLILVVFAGLLGFASCETGDPECYEVKVVSGLLGFQRRDTVIVKDTVGTDPISTINDTIYQFYDSFMTAPELKILDEDTVLTVLGANKSSQLLMAFNQAKDSVRYTFRTDTASTVYDTITVYYNSNLHFISNNCGYNYYFGIKRISHTTNMLDSFALINGDVTEAATRNVQFYFKRTF